MMPKREPEQPLRVLVGHFEKGFEPRKRSSSLRHVSRFHAAKGTYVDKIPFGA